MLLLCSRKLGAATKILRLRCVLARISVAFAPQRAFMERRAASVPEMSDDDGSGDESAQSTLAYESEEEDPCAQLPLDEEESEAPALRAAQDAGAPEDAPEDPDELLERCFRELRKQTAALDGARPAVSEAVAAASTTAELLARRRTDVQLLELARLMETTLLAMKRLRDS